MIVKKALIAMVAMFLLIVWPGGAIWYQFSRIIGGGVSESYLYPVYGGIILLSGLVVGCTSIVLNEIKSLKDEMNRENDGDSKEG